METKLTTGVNSLTPVNLEDYFFDVEERRISLPPKKKGYHLPVNKYKAIVRISPGGDKLVSVVKSSYRLVHNRQLIEPFLEQVQKLGVSWKMDTSHSFAESNRMRLQITFPDLCLQDGESRIPLSLFLHNSYDMNEGVRLFWGAIRAICSNGLVFGSLLGSFYGRHISGFSFERLEHQFDQAVKKTGQVQGHINRLAETPVNEELMGELQQALGVRRLQSIIKTDCIPDKSQWQMLNDITYHISHDIEKPRRADFQMKVSRAFQL